MPIKACRPLSCSPDIYEAAVTCTSCGTPAPICCLKITRAAWAEPVIIKRAGHAIGGACTGTSVTNYCGRLDEPYFKLGRPVNPTCNPVPLAVASWQVRQDCDVMLSVALSGYYSGNATANSGVHFPAVTFSGVVPDDWNSAPLTLWNFDATESITVEVCSGTDAVFPPSDPNLMLKATLWYEDITETLVVTDPAAFAKGSGTTICGTPITCEGDTFPGWDGGGFGVSLVAASVSWYYELDSGKVRVIVTAQWSAGVATTISRSSASFDWSPTWADSSFVIPALGSDGVTIIGEWRVVKVTDCDDPGGCEPVDCYPLCVVNTCPGDPPGTVNAISPSLTWDGIEIGHFEYTIESGWTFYPTDPFGGWEAQLYCTTPGVPADGQTLFIDPPIEWDGPTSWVIHMSCTGGVMDDIVIEVSVPPETVVITLMA